LNIRTAERALDGIRDTNMAKLRTNLLRWMRVSIDNPSQADGYPTSTIGADAATARSAPVDEQEAAELGHLTEDQLGHASTTQATSVERAVMAKKRRDVIDMNTAVAAGWIVQAEDLLRRAENKLAENERYQSNADLNPKPGCWVMARIEVFEESHRTSDLNGLFDEPKPICRWVYDFSRALNRLPSRDECRKHARGERVMVKPSEFQPKGAAA